METNSTHKLLESALRYARNGWHIFPCKPNSKIPLIGKMEGGNGCIDATTDENQIRKWWGMCPNANIGLLCGEKSGVAVVDIDVKDGKNGWETLKAFPELPKTVTQMTPTGGAHKIFKTATPPKNRNGFPTKTDGIDIRSNNYYIMLAPSIHPDTKTEYSWADGGAPWESHLAEFPDYMRPEKLPAPKRAMPWETAAKKSTGTDPVVRPAIIPVPGNQVSDRARLYLRECEPAIQGNAGHNALMWAARALVVGFEMDDASALSLLWEEFNPRCVPPWDALSPSDVRDFERKVRQVQDTPSTKPRGWLLEEFGLRSGDDALARLGAQFAESILAGLNSGSAPAAQDVEVKKRPYKPFPSACFTAPVRDYISKVSKAHCVDESFVGLPVLITAATAIGNKARLQLKSGYVVPPTLWGAVVSPSGTNKSGPLRDVIAPLRSTIPINKLPPNPLLCPQGRQVLSDVTLEAVIVKLSENPCGQMVFRGELAGWLNSFNAYKKSGGDEQAWLEFWDAHEYQLDRKTNGEEMFIPAASVSVIGGIQPAILAKCFDPEKFASGLVPRLLIAAPPTSPRYWSDDDISEEDQVVWTDIITKLRLISFKEIDPTNAQFKPVIIQLDPMAKDRYRQYFDSISFEMETYTELERTFGSKNQVIAARFALILHCLSFASGDITDIMQPVKQSVMENATELAKWFLNEQFRVYGSAKAEHEENVHAELYDYIKSKWGGTVTVRKLHASNQRKYNKSSDAKAALDTLVACGRAIWTEHGQGASVTLVEK